MKVRIRTGGQNKFKLNERIADNFKIEDGDIFDLDISPEQILLRKTEQQE